MKLSVDLQGVASATALLRDMGRMVDPVLRGTLNSTAAHARSAVFAPPINGVFRRAVSRRLVLKRAGTKRLDARIIASSSGIPVDEYARWGYTQIAPTRAVVWVVGLQGRKVAAGFVNPAGLKKLPLRTRSQVTRRRTYTYQGALSPALGPSMAYWFRQQLNEGNVQRVNDYMLVEFDRRMAAELAKGSRA